MATNIRLLYTYQGNIHDTTSTLQSDLDPLRWSRLYRGVHWCWWIEEDQSYSNMSGEFVWCWEWLHDYIKASSHRVTGRTDLVTVLNGNGHTMSSCKVQEVEAAVGELHQQEWGERLPANITSVFCIWQYWFQGRDTICWYHSLYQQNQYTLLS